MVGTLQDLYAKLDELEALLEEDLEECRKSGFQYAEHEAEYRKALRVEIMAERRKGTPVTVTSDICRGMEHIADLKQARDAAEALYKTSQEAINVHKLRLRMVDAEIQRIWNSGGTGYGE